MTFHNASIKTHLLDPICNTSKFQTEFRLPPDTVHLSNMRLLNVGCSTQAQVTSNVLAGAHSVIRSIHSHDGDQLIDQLLEANIWAAFSQFNKSNSHNTDVETWNSKNGLGCEVVSTNGVRKMTNTHATAPANTTTSTTGPGWLSLGQLPPFLKSQSYVPSTVFQNLRLVIHHDTDMAKIGPSVNTAATDTVAPLLVVDELVSDMAKQKVLSQCQGATWNAVEHDRLVLDQEADSAGVMSKSFTVNGFDNKTVDRMVIVNSPVNNTDDVSTSYGTLGSKMNHNQIIQVRINGANVFARNGITRPAERMARLTDAWGTCDAFTPFTGVGGNDTDQLVDRSKLGNTDHFGCVVMLPVSEFQIDHQREIPASGTGNNARCRQQLFLNIFCEVPKPIMLNGPKSHNVMYVQWLKKMCDHIRTFKYSDECAHAHICTMSTNSTIIQLREADCGSRTNGDFEAVLPKPINISNGDQMIVKGSFVDIKTTASTDITITNDIAATIGTVLCSFDHDVGRTAMIDMAGTAVNTTVFPTGSTFVRCREILHPTTANDPNSNLDLVTTVEITAHLNDVSPFVQDRHQWKGEPVSHECVLPITNTKTTIHIPVPIPNNPSNTKTITISVNLLIVKSGGFTLVGGVGGDQVNQHKSASPTIVPCASESNCVPMVDTANLTIPAGVHKPSDLAKRITDTLSLSFPSTTVDVPGVDSNFLQSTANTAITTTASKTFSSDAANITTFNGSTTIQTDIGTAAFRVIGDHIKLTFQNPKPANLNGIPIAQLDGKVFTVVVTQLDLVGSQPPATRSRL